MNAVVDTNVVAYFLLGTQEFVEEARGFWRAVKNPSAPAVWEAEIANVVWMAVRSGILPNAEASNRLRLAGRLGIHSVSSKSLWQGALQRAMDSGVAVRDTLFVELAIRQKVPLATFDAQVISKFPQVAMRPGQLLKHK